MSIRPAAPTDAAAIKALAVDAKMFTPEEVDFFDGPLSAFFDGSEPDSRWLVVEGEDGLAAAAYFAPEPFADRMWNLYFVAVSPQAQGQGWGTIMIEHVEAQLRELGDARARTLIVETSSTDKYADTREFYRNRGFEEEARIRQFYGPTDDKVVFWKALR